MTRRPKWIAGVILLVAGTGLIGWNLRDPDRAYREKPKEEKDVTISQVPAAVQSTVTRESAGGIVEDLEEEKKDGKTTYEVDIVRGTAKIELQIAEDGSVLERESKQVKAKG